MNSLDVAVVNQFIQDNIGPDFHDKKITKLKALSLEDIISRKNPYLFKAKATNTASEFIEAVLDATASSGEETIFGNFLEKVAIFVCSKVRNGRKSGIVGIDLEFEEATNKYLISIKSGPNWGNSSQITALVSKFNAAKKTLNTSGGAKGLNIICVEACCYGTDSCPEKGTHQKLCGQRFWELISGSETLYKDIIEPLGYMAKERNAELSELYSSKLNIFTGDFINKFCDNGIINWNRLIEYNSGKNKKQNLS